MPDSLLCLPSSCTADEVRVTHNAGDETFDLCIFPSTDPDADALEVSTITVQSARELYSWLGDVLPKHDKKR